MALGVIAVLALLISQTGLVLHALEHLAAAGTRGTANVSSLSTPADLTDAGKSPGEGVCLKCLEGASHATALTGGAPAVILAGAHVLAALVIPADPAVRAVAQPRQRGPPASFILS